MDEDIWLERNFVDRAAELRLTPGAVADALAADDTLVLEVSRDRVAALLDPEPGLSLRAPRRADADALAFLLGRLPAAGEDHLTLPATGPLVVGVVVDADTPGLVGLRELATLLDGPATTLAGTAVTLALNHQRFPFCARCGQPNEPFGAGWVRRCEGCGTDSYPRTDPVIIFSVLSQDGERMVISRGPNFKPNGYSCPAGFVDACEHPAEAVAREAMEELGVRVTDVEPVGMQPWPMNLQLMMGYTCRTTDETLVPQPGEVDDARWVGRAELEDLLARDEVRLPGRYALGRVLIERFLGHPVELPSEPPRGVVR